MSRRCSVNSKKGVLKGHNVSHSNRKTKRRFLPNLQAVTFLSDILNSKISLRLSTNSIRTVEHNEGIDNFLLSTASGKLDKVALRIKKRIVTALEKAKEQVSA